MTLTEYVIKRPSVVVVSILVIAIFGIISYTNLSYELLPKFNIPTLTVVTVYPGASPDEVESEITKKIEDNISTLENIKRIRSTSYENLSVVILEMNNGVDIDDAQGKAQRKLNAVVSSLPDAAKAPTVSKVSSDDFPILKFSLSSKEKSNTAFYQFIKDRIVPQLSSIKGVASVSLIGGEERAIRVEIDQEKLKAYNMSLLMVSQSIGQNNINFPTGKLDNNVSALRIKLGGKFQSLEDLENLIIARLPTGSRIKLSDIATIIDSKKDAETINRINGKSSIGLNISKQEVSSALLKLHQLELIHYYPATDKPRLYFTEGRHHPNRIPLSLKAWEKRLNKAKTRFEAMANYLSESKICRSTKLVNYFGETDIPPCGICDVCIANKHLESSDKEEKRRIFELRILLANHALSLESIASNTKGNPENTIKTLRYLVDQGSVVESKNGDFQWKMS